MESYDELRRFVLKRTPRAVHQKVDLVLEELLLNVIHYAYTGNPDSNYADGAGQRTRQVGTSETDPAMEVELDRRSGADGDSSTAEEFIVRIRDWGRPFDPVQRARPDTNCSMEKRTLGGLGILLVRRMADSMSYRRETNQNVVDVRFIVIRKESP